MIVESLSLVSSCPIFLTLKTKAFESFERSVSINGLTWHNIQEQWNLQNGRIFSTYLLHGEECLKFNDTLSGTKFNCRSWGIMRFRAVLSSTGQELGSRVRNPMFCCVYFFPC